HAQSIQLDAAVLQSLYAAHARALAAYACTLTSSLEEAEDLVHEAFVSVLGSAARASMPLAYLMRAIRNKAMDHGRAATARCRAEQSARVIAPRSAERTERTEVGIGAGAAHRHESSEELASLTAAACAALAALSPAAAEIVTLRTRCGLSFPEIALILDEPVGTISARYVRAIATVRAALLAGVNHD
ncbi:MAG: sigma-70 family RNA polymerase sigma factor, partial [Planctomycetota bacterium]|nr:sigma-70 family RNA polymerase sigma factor [Planctomycetota bacterium]